MEQNNPQFYGEIFDTVKKLAESDNRKAMVILGDMYWGGKYVDRDLNEAAKWMRMASERGVSQARIKLFDILVELGNPDYYNLMISTLFPLIGVGNVGALRRLAKAYRFGLGVEKNLKKSIEYMYRVYDSKSSWVAQTICDMLMELGDDSRYKEMLELLAPFVKLQDPGAIGRLARAYRDGLGVPKNLAEGIRLMSIAADNKIPWAIRELDQMKKIYDTV